MTDPNIRGNRLSALRRRSLIWAASGLGALAICFALGASKFLAVNRPLGKGILVVEGWVPAKALMESARIFHSGDYSYLVVVGGPPGQPATYTDRAAQVLEQSGFEPKQLIKISEPRVTSNRTLTGAEDVKHWLQQSGTNICCVDVFTAQFHARKSWIVYQYALGRNYRVGVIAGQETTFDSRYWFVSPRGIWIVSRNLVGYLYYRFLILGRGDT